MSIDQIWVKINHWSIIFHTTQKMKFPINDNEFGHISWRNP